MRTRQLAVSGLPGKPALDGGIGRDIVQACETIEDCAHQLSLTVSRLGRMKSLGPEESEPREFKSQLDQHMSELDGNIRQILDAVKRIGGDLRAKPQQSER
jgi:hypothetical protein